MTKSCLLNTLRVNEQVKSEILEKGISGFTFWSALFHMLYDLGQVPLPPLGTKNMVMHSSIFPIIARLLSDSEY